MVFEEEVRKMARKDEAAKETMAKRTQEQRDQELRDQALQEMEAATQTTPTIDEPGGMPTFMGHVNSDQELRYQLLQQLRDQVLSNPVVDEGSMTDMARMVTCDWCGRANRRFYVCPEEQCDLCFCSIQCRNQHVDQHHPVANETSM